MEEVMYRTEAAYGSGIRDIVQVICYEVFSLGNTDVLHYLLGKHTSCFNMPMQHEMLSLCKVIDGCTAVFDDTLEEEHLEKIRQIVTAMNSYYNVELKYCLWLADLDTVRQLYDGCEEDIKAYKISQYILSNLGEEGILFAYEDYPTPVSLEDTT